MIWCLFIKTPTYILLYPQTNKTPNNGYYKSHFSNYLATL